MEEKENNKIREQQSFNEDRDNYLKRFNVCLKRCSRDIGILRHKNEYSVNLMPDSEIDMLEDECKSLKRKFKTLENIDDNHFDEIKNNFEIESEELLRKCEEALF